MRGASDDLKTCHGAGCGANPNLKIWTQTSPERAEGTHSDVIRCDEKQIPTRKQFLEHQTLTLFMMCFKVCH